MSNKNCYIIIIAVVVVTFTVKKKYYCINSVILKDRVSQKRTSVIFNVNFIKSDPDRNG